MGSAMRNTCGSRSSRACSRRSKTAPNHPHALEKSPLYPSGEPVTRVLAEVANVFGKGEVFDSTRLHQLADQVAQEIRRQVQWLELDQLAEPVAERIMEYTNPKPDRTFKVYVVGLT